jgi:hypothetical protein
MTNATRSIPIATPIGRRAMLIGEALPTGCVRLER